MATRTKIKLTLALVVLGLFVVVVMQNTEMVTLKVFTWETKLSSIILLTATLALGFALGFLTAKIGSTAKRMREK